MIQFLLVLYGVIVTVGSIMLLAGLAEDGEEQTPGRIFWMVGFSFFGLWYFLSVLPNGGFRTFYVWYWVASMVIYIAQVILLGRYYVTWVGAIIAPIVCWLTIINVSPYV